MKIFNYWYLSLVVLLSLGIQSCVENKATFGLAEDKKLIEFTTDRFTLPNLHVTPDGKSIIFDVLGDIYQVPIEGGKAEVLLQDNHWKRAGKLSPDGNTLAYTSDEMGEFQVWTYHLKTQEKKVYPTIEFFMNPLEAYWDYKSDLIIPSKEGVRSYVMDDGKESIIRHVKEDEKSLTSRTHRTATIGNQGKKAYLQNNKSVIAFDLLNKGEVSIGNLDSIKTSANKEKIGYMKNFKVSPSGTKIVFFNKTSLMLWDLIINEIKLLCSLNKLGSSTFLGYSFDFIDDQTIIFDMEGELVRMDIETGEYTPIPIKVEIKKVIKKPLRREPQYIKDSVITASVLRNPVTKVDLDTIYFGAFGKLNSYAKNTETITELHPDKDRFEMSPSLSPNGKYLAYTTWNDVEMGHVYAREIKTSKEYQLTKTPGRYINPAWSPDGTEIVFVADETEAKMGTYSQKASRGPKYLVYGLDIHRVSVLRNYEIIEKQETAIIRRIYPSTNLPRRFYPIPSYHPDGNSIYINTRNNDDNLAVIQEIELESRQIKNEYRLPFHIDEVLISPDAKHIAFIFDEQVWLDQFPHNTKLQFSSRTPFIPEVAYVDGGYVLDLELPRAKSIYEIAPSYLFWQDKNTLLWGAVEGVYTYNLQRNEVNKLANIEVQKPRAIPKTKYALTNAKIITINKEDEIIENGTVLVKDNRIEAVGDIKKVLIPPDYKVYNLKGKTIIPGLIDVHAHYHLSPYEFTNQQEYQYVSNLAYGVTSIYDPSVNVLDYREQAQMVETGQLLGPRVFASGNIILENPGSMEYDYNRITKLEDAQRVVHSLNKLGIAGPIKEYGFRNGKKMGWLRKAAKMEGMSITAHQSHYEPVPRRIIRGYSAIEHEISGFRLQKDAIELLGQSGIHYTPTYLVTPGIKDFYANETKLQAAKLLRFNGETVYQNNYDSTYDNVVKERQAIIDDWSTSGIKEHERATRTLNDIIEIDGKLSIGGHGNPLPGLGAHWELWFMTKGMSNYQALQAATINGAEKLDFQEEIGSIEEGKLADMIVLNNDPLKDIFNTIEILYTVQNGSIYEAETMKQIYPIEKELGQWGWDSPVVFKYTKDIYSN